MASIINASTSAGLVSTADTSGDIALQNNGTTAVTVTGGNVGVGTTSPAAKLEATVSNGTHRLGTNGSDTNYNVRANSGSNCSITWTENGQADRWTVGCVTGQGYLAFRYNSSNMGNGTEAMRIDSSGRAFIGATTAPNIAANPKLTVVASGTDWVSQFQSGYTTGSGRTVIGFYDGSNDFTGQISIDASANTTSYQTSSDYRLKENIAPMTGALNKVSLLKPVTYKWKSDGSDAQGFIAHELQEVFPEAVGGEKDAVDAEGKPVYQGIDTSFLVATLTAAIQELTAKVTALEAKVGA